MLSLIPAAKVGHIGLYRDPETLNPVDYYCKLPPDVSERDIIIVAVSYTHLDVWHVCAPLPAARGGWCGFLHGSGICTGALLEAEAS